MGVDFTDLFKNGEELIFKRGDVIYKRYETIAGKSIFFIKEGLITLRIPKKSGEKIRVYRQRGELFGIDETFVLKNRLGEAVAEENTVLYAWDKTDFFLNASINWELSLFAIRSLSSYLRVINSEFLESKTISF